MFTLKKTSVLPFVLALLQSSRSRELQSQYDNSFLLGQIIGIVILIGGIAIIALVIWLIIKAVRKKSNAPKD